jgi:predicted anti-sigma-YlaC factor YlaD
MNRPDQHPDSDLLDQLRAGLLDHDASRKAEVEAHLSQCGNCRQRYDWPTALRVDEEQSRDLDGRLNLARRRALASTKKPALRRFAPLAAAAAIALIAVLAVRPLQSPDEQQTRVAGTTPAAVPEVYEDLDFYLWLADHKATPDSST